MFLVLSVVFGFVALSAAQKPNPCVAPKLFEARVFHLNADRKDVSFGKMSYDALQQRVRIVDTILEGQAAKKEVYDVLYLHQTGKLYILNMMTKQCTTQAIATPFVPIEVPTNATYYGTYYIGTAFPGYGVQADSWGGASPSGNVVSSWTAGGCVPIHFGVSSNFVSHQRTDFFDVTFGISDPTVFNIPAECMHGESATQDVPHVAAPAHYRSRPWINKL